MGLSTHVLDTMNGCPAAGMQVALYTTQGEQATLGAHGMGQWLPFRPANRAQHNRITLLCSRQCIIAQRHTVLINRRTANQPIFSFNLKRTLRVNPANQLLNLGHHFRADTIAFCDSDGNFLCHNICTYKGLDD